MFPVGRDDVMEVMYINTDQLFLWKHNTCIQLSSVEMKISQNRLKLPCNEYYPKILRGSFLWTETHCGLGTSLWIRPFGIPSTGKCLKRQCVSVN